MAERFYVSSGGGIRIGATFGAQYRGEQLGLFNPADFNYFVGTSAGALDAVLTANGWNSAQKLELFTKSDLAGLFSQFGIPFGLRKYAAVKWPIPLKKMAAFIDGLGLKPHPGLLVNSVNFNNNRQVVFCQKRPHWWVDSLKVDLVEVDFSDKSLGTIITRSMALPGLLSDDPKWKDGGYIENPLLSVLPRDADILLISLGYAGDVVRESGKMNLFEEMLYIIEQRGHAFQQNIKEEFSDLKVIYPKVWDVDSAAFELSEQQRLDMWFKGDKNTVTQWKALL